MCLAVYLAADEEPPLVPWDETHPGFHVVALAGEPDESARRQFSKRYVVYLGSHEGCGCGFDYGQDPEAVEPEEDEASRRSVSALVDYLKPLLARLGTLELFSCWEGDQGVEPLSRRCITLSAIGGDSFCFQQKELLHLGR